MKQGFRQSMAWLHTWTGLLVGWLLLLIFMAGAASYYRQEITRWMRADIPTANVSRAHAALRGIEYLNANAANAEQWTVNLPDDRTEVLRVFWRQPAPTEADPSAVRARRFGNAQLEAATGGEITARDTRGGEFFYRLHFDLHYLPAVWARYIVGFCAMFMLVAIVTGVITHKKIFREFFTFRPGKGLRSWLDFHNASAVMALPYHVMITYTGIVTLMFLYLPWGVDAAYPNEEGAFFTEAFSGLPEARAASGSQASMLPVDRLLEDARRQWNGADVGAFIIHHPGDANALVDIRQHGGARLSSEQPLLRFDAVTGQLLMASDEPGAASETRGVMYGLHIARFAGPGLRFLFFLSGLAGCVMVASGVIMWAVKERPKHVAAGRRSLGLYLVDALNIGAVAGLPIAFCTFFWANRLLPADLPERAAGEVDSFFIAWALSLAAALAWPRRCMWAWQLYMGGALFILLPVLNAFTTEAHLGNTLRSGDWVLAGFDLIALGCGLLLAYAARRMQRWRAQASAAERRTSEAAARASAQFNPQAQVTP